MSTIDIDTNGNATVFGDVAHKVWNYGKGEIPRQQMGRNRFFVLDSEGDVRAAQSTLDGALRYMTAERVLVSIN